MENNTNTNGVNDQIRSQNEMIADLQQQFNNAQDENEKRSITLKMNVARAKLAELQNQAAEEQNQNVEEEAPQQTKDFLDTDNNGYTMTQNKLNESLPTNYSKSQFFKKDIPDAISVIEILLKHIKEQAKKENDGGVFSNISADFKSIASFATMVANNCNDLNNYARNGTLTEGCMTKKFENMSNRDVAEYIFRHPHTKFGDKVKECNAPELIKAMQSWKKANEETTTANVASTDTPSMYMKRPTSKLKEDATTDYIRDIIDDVDDDYGWKAAQKLKKAIYQERFFTMSPRTFEYAARKAEKSGHLRELINAILDGDERTWEKMSS